MVRNCICLFHEYFILCFMLSSINMGFFFKKIKCPIFKAIAYIYRQSINHFVVFTSHTKKAFRSSSIFYEMDFFLLNDRVYRTKVFPYDLFYERMEPCMEWCFIWEYVFSQLFSKKTSSLNLFNLLTKYSLFIIFLSNTCYI